MDHFQAPGKFFFDNRFYACWPKGVFRILIAGHMI